MAGPLLWTPAGESSIAAWWDASDSSTVAAGSTFYWYDKNGNTSRYVSQATTANKPSYQTEALNGLNTVRFDGSTDFLSMPSGGRTLLRNVPGAAVFAVSSRTGGSNSYDTLFMASAASSTSYRVGLGHESSQIRASVMRVDGGSWVYITKASSATQLSSMLIDFVNGPYKIGCNGSYSSYTYAGYGGNTSNTTSTYCYLGKSPPSTAYFGGDIGEIIVLNAYPSQALYERIEGYLAHKWGLTGSLPSGHPYKTVAPFTGHDFDAIALRLALAAFVGQSESADLSHTFPGIPLRLALAAFTTNYVPSTPPDLSGLSGTVATLYRASINDIALPISGMQCRRRLGASTWLTVKVPGWTSAMQTWLQSCIGASLIVEMGTSAADYGMWLNAVVTEVDAERAPFGAGFRVTARVQNPSYTAGARPLRGVSQRLIDGARRGAVCAVDGLLKPNDTVDDGLASWTVGTAEYRIDASGARMTVWEDA